MCSAWISHNMYTGGIHSCALAAVKHHCPFERYDTNSVVPSIKSRLILKVFTSICVKNDEILPPCLYKRVFSM